MNYIPTQMMDGHHKLNILPGWQWVLNTCLILHRIIYILKLLFMDPRRKSVPSTKDTIN